MSTAQPSKPTPDKPKQPTTSKPDSKLSKYMKSDHDSTLTTKKSPETSKIKAKVDSRHRPTTQDASNNEGKRQRASSSTRKQWNRKPKNEVKDNPAAASKTSQNLMQPILKNVQNNIEESKMVMPKIKKLASVQQDDQGQEKFTNIQNLNKV